MSCRIANIESQHLGPGYSEMAVTAYVGANFTGTECFRRSSIQFSIGDKYCALTGDQVMTLIKTLLNRITYEDGYTATGPERDKLILKEDGKFK